MELPQTTPTGIAATRNIRGRWYDLFVSHQVVFPLVPGTVSVPRATLKYSTPVALQFFSQEERFALSSRAETLAVHPLPAAGRPAGFAGAIASGLTLERQIDPATASVGEGLAVELRLTGLGNTALWPNPDVRWPAGVRAYLERVDEHVRTTEGQVGGTKTFRYLVVPDSAGALALPGVHYAYFDLAAARYAELAVAPMSVPVAARGESAAAAALPPALVGQDRPALAWMLAHRIPDWIWIVLLALPPVLATARGRLPARPRRRRKAPGLPRSDLRSAEAALDQLVQSLAPDPDRRFGAALTSAVRAAGADAELAARVSAVRERLLARRYGRDAAAADDAALAAEAQDVVRRLGGSLRGSRARGALLALFVVALAGRTGAQNPRPSSCTNPARSGRPRRDSRVGRLPSPPWRGTGTTWARRTIASGPPGARKRPGCGRAGWIRDNHRCAAHWR